MGLEQSDIENFEALSRKWKALPEWRQKDFQKSIKEAISNSKEQLTSHVPVYVKICDSFGKPRADKIKYKDLSDVITNKYTKLYVEKTYDGDRSRAIRKWLAPTLFWFCYYFEAEAQAAFRTVNLAFEPLKDYEFLEKEKPRIAKSVADASNDLPSTSNERSNKSISAPESLTAHSDEPEHTFYADDALLTPLFQKSTAFQSKVIENYEPHGIVGELKRFMGKHSSGVWHLTGEAGTGKTSIIAGIADTPPLNATTIAYYFGRGFEATNELPLNWFYQYAIHALTETYDLPPSGTAQKHYPELFSHILLQLSEAGKISQKKPLILCIDAIDELIDTDPNGVRAARQLLSHKLPEGVFIACSELMKDNDPQSTLGFKQSNYNQEDIHALANLKYTIRAARKFVRRLVLKSPVILNNLNITDDDKKLDAFVNAQCKAAKYNFMLLRLIFNDPDSWHKDGLMFNAQDGLDGYYKYLHKRMTQKSESRIGEGSHSVELRASYCFALLKRMTRKTFMALMGQRHNVLVADKANDALEGWIKQSLIYEQPDPDDNWLSVYHFSYRTYLSEKLENSHPSEFIVPFANCQIDDFNLGGDLRELETDSPEACAGWVKLVLKVLTKSKKTKELEMVLKNQNFAQLACETREGLSIIIHELSEVPFTSGKSKKAFARALRAGAISLLDWAEKGFLLDKNGAKYTHNTIKEMASSGHPLGQQYNSLALSKFIVHPNREY